MTPFGGAGAPRPETKPRAPEVAQPPETLGEQFKLPEQHKRAVEGKEDGPTGADTRKEGMEANRAEIAPALQQETQGREQIVADAGAKLERQSMPRVQRGFTRIGVFGLVLACVSGVALGGLALNTRSWEVAALGAMLLMMGAIWWLLCASVGSVAAGFRKDERP